MVGIYGGASQDHNVGSEERFGQRKEELSCDVSVKDAENWSHFYRKLWSKD